MTNKIFKRSAAFMAMCIAIIMCFFVLAPIVACGGGEKEEEKQPVTITALDKENLDLEAGSAYALKATLSRTLESGEAVTWTSDKETVATVDSKGKVTGVAGGTAIITASINDTSKTCTVTVKDKYEIKLSSTSLAFDNSSAEKSATLTATCTKNGAADTNATVTWKSSAEGVATVASGVVTATGKGTATITATYNGVEATCEVKVVDYEVVASEKDYFAAVNWYQFGDGVTTPVENAVQDGKVVISDTPARADLFKVQIDPANDKSAYINPMDNVNNFDKEGGQKFYGYEYLFDIAVSSTGNFDLIIGATNSLPAQFSNAYRGLYFYFKDGEVELKQSGIGGDTVQATASYSGKVTDINSVTFSITRIDDTSFLVKLFVNGQKLELTGNPSAGTIQGGNFLDNKSVNQSNGYGPRFGVVPESNSTVTISAITIKREVK